LQRIGRVCILGDNVLALNLISGDREEEMLHIIEEYYNCDILKGTFYLLEAKNNDISGGKYDLLK